MRGLNKVTLIGNLGKDPEVQVLEGNVPVAKFSLATSETYRDKSGQPQISTDWHTVVLWRGLAELAQAYLRKGSLVYLEGKLKTRHYDDAAGASSESLASTCCCSIKSPADSNPRARP